MIKKISILFLALFIAQLATAQRERNYIYLLDCTKSMIGYNGAPMVWASTLKYIEADIQRHTPNTMVHIVPFQGKVLPDYKFVAQNFKKEWPKIKENLGSAVQKVTNTNICDAWDSGLKYIDKNKDNYIYLLTDGGDNVKGPAMLANKLDAFCSKIPNTYAFYVLLTKNAKNAIDTRIKAVVDNCPNETFVDVTEKIKPFGCVNDSIVYANTLNLSKTHKLNFSALGTFKAIAKCDDDNFSVAISGGKIKDGNISVKIQAKKDIKEINENLPDTYEFMFRLNSDDINILNPEIRVIMTNKAEREFEIINQEYDMGKAEWYDSFLFWKEKEPDTLKVDLKAKFNEEAVKDGSEVTIVVVDEDASPQDYKLYFNGEEITDGKIRLKAKSMADSSVLAVVYLPTAKEGNHYLQLRAKNCANLEKISGNPFGAFAVSARGEYDIVWNPLKLFLVWLAIIVVIALLIWFLMLKPMLYPKFKIGSIMITDPYFSSIKLKSARQVIFTNKKVEQSAISKLFTGDVLCNVNECWSQPLVLLPSKKKILVQRNKNYVFDPYGSQLSSRTEYVIENLETTKKIKMTIN